MVLVVILQSIMNINQLTRFICNLLPYLYPSNYLKEDAPKLVILFVGVNDATYEEVWPLQYVPVETYGKNIEFVNIK